jgi:hypothetical protein
MEHAWERDVDAVAGLAAGLVGAVEAGEGLPDHAESARRLQCDRRRIGGRDARGGLGELRITQTAVLRMDDLAGFGATLRGRHVPAGGCRGDEQRARRRAAPAQGLPGVANARAAAGDLGAEKRVRVRGGIDGRLHDADLARVDLELFGDEHREGGVDVLAHLVAGTDQRNRPVATDLDPGIGLEEGVADGRGRRGRCFGGRRLSGADRRSGGAPALPDLAADGEAAADDRDDFEETPTREGGRVAHTLPSRSCAAARIACRTRP